MSERKSREQVPDEEVWACVAATILLLLPISSPRSSFCEEEEEEGASQRLFRVIIIILLDEKNFPKFEDLDRITRSNRSKRGEIAWVLKLKEGRVGRISSTRLDDEARVCGRRRSSVKNSSRNALGEAPVTAASPREKQNRLRHGRGWSA